MYGSWLEDRSEIPGLTSLPLRRSTSAGDARHGDGLGRDYLHKTNLWKQGCRDEMFRLISPPLQIYLDGKLCNVWSG